MFQSDQLFRLQGSRQGCVTWRGLAWALGRTRRGQRGGLHTSCHPCLQRGYIYFICRFHLQIQCTYYSLPSTVPGDWSTPVTV